MIDPRDRTKQKLVKFASGEWPGVQAGLALDAWLLANKVQQFTVSFPQAAGSDGTIDLEAEIVGNRRLFLELTEEGIEGCIYDRGKRTIESTFSCGDMDDAVEYVVDAVAND